jgi:hypothetical protein
MHARQWQCGLLLLKLPRFESNSLQILPFNLFFLQKNGYVATNNLPYFLFKAANTSPSI